MSTTFYLENVDSTWTRQHAARSPSIFFTFFTCKNVERVLSLIEAEVLIM